MYRTVPYRKSPSIHLLLVLVPGMVSVRIRIYGRCATNALLHGVTSLDTLARTTAV